MKFQTLLVVLCSFILISYKSFGQIAKPNIIFIMADDLGYGDLGTYGQTNIQTPHLDRLATTGAKFTNAYAGASVCAPSRCSLLTGKHNGNNRIRDNVPHGVYLQPDDFTIAELLKQAGYKTGGIGKWGLGNPGSWGVPNQQGFDYYYGHYDQDQAHYYYPDHLWENDKVVLLKQNKAGKKGAYTHDLFTQKSMDFIKQNAQNPFFLYLAYTVPHFSDYSRKSPEVYIVPSDEPYTDKPWTQTAKNYAAMITRMDRDIGQIQALITELGLAENTIIVFTSDNGPYTDVPEPMQFFNSNGSLKGGKRSFYEGGIRVPFIVNWKNVIQPNTQIDTPIAFWDVMPTLADLINYPSSITTDGISILPLFSSGHSITQNERAFYWDYGHTRDEYQQAVRKGKFKGIQTFTRTQAPTFELYDLIQDPKETTNIAKRHPSIVLELKQIMQSSYQYSTPYARKK
jgi:arylsulfatase A-like enzyme